MAIDSTLPARRAILTVLKNNASLNELLPAANIFTQASPREPSWPFGRYENYGQSTPIVATCLDGQELTVRFHVFAKPREVAGIVVETAEDMAARIMARVASALDRRRLTINRGHLYIGWIGSYLLQDGDEPDAFHGICSMRIRCMTV
jgi:hypothetical protein